MKVQTLLSLITLYCMAIACNQPGHCPEELTYGPYHLTEESSAFTPPFQAADTLVFRNDAGEELLFFQIQSPVSGPGLYSAWDVPCGRSGEDMTQVRLIQDQYRVEYYTHSNYSLYIHQLVAYVGPNCPPNADVDESNFFDQLKVAVMQPRLSNPAQYDLTYVMLPTSDRGNSIRLDGKDSPQRTGYQHLPEFTFRGETYRDVYTTAGPISEQRLFFSRDYRLITFVDPYDERWWLAYRIAPGDR